MFRFRDMPEPSAPIRRYALPLVLLLGLLIRLPLLPLPGTEDMYSFQMWGALALRHGLTNVYTLNDTDVLTGALLAAKGVRIHFRVQHMTDLGPAGGVPDYPPGNILALELSAALARLLQGEPLHPGPLLNACMNLLPVLFSLATALALLLFLRKEGLPGVLSAVAAFWLNPAIILTSPTLGYTDPIFAFLCLVSLILCFRRRYTSCVFLLALACLTKPQGAFAVPVVATALFAEGRWRSLWRYGLRLAFFGLLLLLPFIVAGRFLGIFAGVSQQAMYPALSAQQLNIWWLVGGVVQVSRGVSQGVLPSVITMVSKADFVSWAGFHPLWIALPAFGTFTGVNLYYLYSELRAGNRWALFWAAALEVYGYTMLSLFVHENHLYAFFVYAAPLLALGSAVPRRLFWGLSAVYGLNLYLFDGFGQGLNGLNHWVRSLPGFDLTLPIALANLATFLLLLRSKEWCFHFLTAGNPATRAWRGESGVPTCS